MPTKPLESPHRRFNPLTGEWLLVLRTAPSAPGSGRWKRLRRRICLLTTLLATCARGTAGRAANKTRRIHLRSSSITISLRFCPAAAADEPQPELLVSRSVTGTCRVVCFSPRHDLTLAEMPVADIRRVIDAWAEQITDLGETYRWVQVFENKGAVMGCSNPHPHGQIWALDALPDGAGEGRPPAAPLLFKAWQLAACGLRPPGAERQERLVVENEHWVVVVPYWAVWPFETLLLPRQRIQRLPDLGDVQRLPWRTPSTTVGALRQPFRDFLPLLHGLACRALR